MSAPSDVVLAQILAQLESLQTSQQTLQAKVYSNLIAGSSNQLTCVL